MKKEAGYPHVALTLTLALGCLMLLSEAVAAQRKPQPKMEPQGTSAGAGGDLTAAPGILVAADQDYRIGPRDVIEIKVDDAPELSLTAEVNADGTIVMHYLKRITVAGKTTDELSKEIADGLRGRYLKDPNVMVSVKQSNSHAFYVLGAVKKPGVYQIEGKPPLLRVITIAGGLADNHGTTAFIFHEVKKNAGSSATPASAAATGNPSSPRPADTASAGGNETEYTVRSVNINGMFKGLGLNGSDAFVEPGDTINISQVDIFFVAGEVNAPGQFPLSDGTTLRQAMALAQGTTFNAATSEGIIFRTDPATGKRDEIKVDIGAIMKNRKPDIPLLASDVVLVPNSKTKTIGNAILKAMGMGTIQRGVIP